jgi:hypothetical protein
MPLQGFSHEEIVQFIQATYSDSPSAKHFFLSRFVLGHIESEEFFPYCVEVLANHQNEDVRGMVFAHAEFVTAVGSLLAKGQAARLLDLSAEQLAR